MRQTVVLFTATALMALTSARGAEIPDRELTVGIDGHYRAGHWTAIRDRGNRPIAAIETRDGDGLRVQYDQLPDARWAYAIPGSESVPLIVRYVTGQGGEEVVVKTRFPEFGSPAQGPSMVPREMPWVVALSDPLGIDTIGANELLGRDATVAVSQPTAAEALPDSALGYDGVDLILIGRAAADLLTDLSPSQRSALVGWITAGGHLFATLGQSAAEALAAAPWLAELLELDQVRTVRINPSALEIYTSTETPLQPFEGLALPRDRGSVLLLARTQRRTNTPLAARYNVGFGQITVVAADLDEPMFAQWPERMDLIGRLTESLLEPPATERVVRNRATAYDDLAGQLRASLDQFSIQRRFHFSVVSLIVLGLIAAIGPLDYLLINRVLGRPLLGWLTLPIVVVGLSAVLIAQSRLMPNRTSAAQFGDTGSTENIQCNRLEIVDVDTIIGTGRGFSANYLYSHDAGRMHVDAAATESLQLLSKQVSQLLIGPLGTAGQAFGGIPIAIEDARLPVYRDAFTEAATTTSSTLIELPMAARSSKGIFTHCRFQPRLSRDVVMQRRLGSELLRGALANPLPVDLLDGMLIYKNWAYLLPTRFPAGGQIASVGSLRQKNFRWLLTRQRLLEQSETQTEAWDPAMTDSVDRIAQMLMFYRAAGGFNYTALRNDPLAGLDLSHALTAHQCMLVGRLAEPLTSIQISNDSAADSTLALQSMSLIRVVLPVTEEETLK